MDTTIFTVPNNVVRVYLDACEYQRILPAWCLKTVDLSVVSPPCSNPFSFWHFLHWDTPRNLAPSSPFLSFQHSSPLVSSSPCSFPVASANSRYSLAMAPSTGQKTDNDFKNAKTQLVRDEILTVLFVFGLPCNSFTILDDSHFLLVPGEGNSSWWHEPEDSLDSTLKPTFHFLVWLLW